MAELSEVFWTFLITSVIGLLVAVLRMLYKSKCSHIACCGCEIERNVDIEEPDIQFKKVYNDDSKENDSKEST